MVSDSFTGDVKPNLQACFPTSLRAAASLASAAGARASQLTQSMRSLWSRTTSPSQQTTQHQPRKGAAAPMRPQSARGQQQRPQAAGAMQQSHASSLRPISAGTQQVTKQMQLPDA